MYLIMYVNNVLMPIQVFSLFFYNNLIGRMHVEINAKYEMDGLYISFFSLHYIFNQIRF